MKSMILSGWPKDNRQDSCRRYAAPLYNRDALGLVCRQSDCVIFAMGRYSNKLVVFDTMLRGTFIWFTATLRDLAPVISGISKTPSSRRACQNRCLLRFRVAKRRWRCIGLRYKDYGSKLPKDSGYQYSKNQEKKPFHSRRGHPD